MGLMYSPDGNTYMVQEVEWIGSVWGLKVVKPSF